MLFYHVINQRARAKDRESNTTYFYTVNVNCVHGKMLFTCQGCYMLQEPLKVSVGGHSHECYEYIQQSREFLSVQDVAKLIQKF